MRKKILLPTDFSENASKAIDFATELYKNEQCDFYILNVFHITGNITEDLMNMDTDSSLYQIKKNHSDELLAKALKELLLRKKRDPKHSFKTLSAFNFTIEAIKEVVEKKDIEMVVMGTKGETYSRTAAFGSTAINVMEKVRNCPVIVVPLKAKSVIPKEIVFPTSYRTHYKKRELNYLIDIAKKSDATIIVLHISEKSELSKEQIENKQLLEEILEGTNHKPHYMSHDSVEEAITDFIERRDSDMVAFINKKHFFFRNILTNPLVKSIPFHAKVPILVMHDLRN